jgi:hypothetical protein
LKTEIEEVHYFSKTYFTKNILIPIPIFKTFPLLIWKKRLNDYKVWNCFKIILPSRGIGISILTPNVCARFSIKIEHMFVIIFCKICFTKIVYFFYFRFPSSLGALFVSTTNFKLNRNFLHQFICTQDLYTELFAEPARADVAIKLWKIKFWAFRFYNKFTTQSTS